MRRCGTCKQWKPESDFAYQSKARGRLNWNCRSCHAIARRSHYERTTATYIENERLRIRGHRERNHALMLAYLLEHPCVDCGETDPTVLEFDHRDPAEKVTDVTKMANRHPWERVLTEIEKCDVRCANCHRKRTATQFGWRRASVVPNPAPVTQLERTVPSPAQLALDLSEVRRCRVCGEWRQASEFAIKNKKTGNRATICRGCQRIYAKAHYEQNHDAYIAKARRNNHSFRDRFASFVVSYFLDHPCVDCGETDPRVLEFDHRHTGEKLATVNALARKQDWDAMLAEVAKCDVRCANCHRRRTAQQFGWTRRIGEDAAAS